MVVILGDAYFQSSWAMLASASWAYYRVSALMVQVDSLSGWSASDSRLMGEARVSTRGWLFTPAVLYLHVYLLVVQAGRPAVAGADYRTYLTLSSWSAVFQRPW